MKICNIYKKFHYQRRSVSHRYKSRRFPGKKIQQKGKFLQQKYSSAKTKHSNTPNGAKPISKRKSQQFSSSRWTAIFSKTLWTIDRQPEILEWVSGLKIDFVLETFQENFPHNPKMSAQESLLVTREVESMLKKGAI